MSCKSFLVFLLKGLVLIDARENRYHRYDRKANDASRGLNLIFAEVPVDLGSRRGISLLQLEVRACPNWHSHPT